MTATSKADRFKEFRNSYDAYKTFSNAAKNLYSEKIEERLDAREGALNYAQNALGIKGLADSAERERVPNSVIDKYFDSAIAQTRKAVSYTMTNSGRGIIEDAPDKGLAEIVIATRPCEIKGDKRHNEIAATHAKFLNMENVIQMYKTAKTDDLTLERHKTALKTVFPYVGANLVKRLKENPAYKGDKEVFGKMFKAIEATLATSQSITVNFAEDLRNEAMEEFDGLTSTDSIKAGYARENLIYWFESGKPKEREGVIQLLGAVKTDEKEDAEED